uniref:F-box domain, leucine-rich repeat domain, L domain-like protein n=1 Tax=Tanacetum cinerariifolium TaxID=118510 RepID=A0A6L2JEP6_TANCI|nr:F-box domain, leucine-rich repeat domain, L domain-like protein [Tanacetum cinerariifolium]
MSPGNVAWDTSAETQPKMSPDVALSHDGDGRGKGKRKPNLGGRAAGRLNTRDKTRNLSLKEITDKKGPVPIQFELRDKQIVMTLDDHAAHWSSYIREVIRGVPLYHPYWLKVLKERNAALITDIGTYFDLRPHMESPDWTEINADIQQHLQKAYNTNKAAFKAQHWVIDPTTRTYNVEKIRRACPKNITASEWDKYIHFWNDPRNIAQAAQNRQNQAKSTVISRQGSRSLARLRYEMRQSSTTQEYPSLIDTFFVAHTVNGEFLRDENRRIYEDMRWLEATDTYTDDEINRLARGGKQRGHIPGVGRVLPVRARASPNMFSQFESGGTTVAGAGTRRRVPTIKMTRMRMVMAILSCVIYGFPGDMSPGNICHRGTNFSTGKYVGPTVSLGKESFASVPSEHSPAISHRGKVSPATSHLGKPGIVAGEWA